MLLMHIAQVHVDFLTVSHLKSIIVTEYESRPKCHLAYFILLAQLVDTLIHYPCTVALPGLADWSVWAFLELALPTM